MRQRLSHRGDGGHISGLNGLVNDGNKLFFTSEQQSNLLTMTCFDMYIQGVSDNSLKLLFNLEIPFELIFRSSSLFRK